jgi:wobble nucleotide-excising tRNase
MAELIIILDDPICSFDSNHIYAMYSIIQKNLSTAKQLFVLTHNADFFGLVKDWMKSRGIPQQSRAFYMVVRQLDANQEWHSNLIVLPRLLEKFKSDYVYTYHCLKSIDSNPAPALEEMCGVPNMVRRILEIYLGFRYPSSDKPAWHDKLDHLFDDELKCGEVQKFADDLSHVHYLHRAMQVPDYVQHCKRMIRDVLEAIKARDPGHIASLEAELNP